MTDWKKLLRSLGFTESEANIYLSSLELGPTAVQEISKKADVSRVTAYAVIEALIKNGLMSTVQKGKKTLYSAESPERLVAFVSARMQDMQATLHDIKSSITDLKLLQRGEKPVVKLFEGREALKAIQEDILQSKAKHLDEFGNWDEILKTYQLEEELKPFYKKFQKLSPEQRLIFLSKDEKMGPAAPGKKVIMLPSKLFQFAGDVLVYGNKVALSTFRGKQISVLIESQDLAQTLRAMFDFIWRCQKK